jgi:hypothetical protein
MRTVLAIASLVALALACGCGASETPASAGDDTGGPGGANDASTNAADASPATQADGGAGLDGGDGDYATVSIDGSPVTPSQFGCEVSDSSNIPTMFCTMTIPNDLTITVRSYHAGDKLSAPLGEFAIPLDNASLRLGVSLTKSVTDVDRSFWPTSRGEGTLRLLAAGKDGLYEGSAEGDFIPTDNTAAAALGINVPTLEPMKFKIAWRTHALP